MEVKEFYSTSETAELLNVTPKTLRTWHKECIFKPEKVEEGVRRYSAKQIEIKAGVSIHQLKDPIMSLSNESKLEDLLCIAEENRRTLNMSCLRGSNTNLMDWIAKFPMIYGEFIEISTKLYRKNRYAPPNFIFCSPEVLTLIECGTSFFPAPSSLELIGAQPVIYHGTLNNRWKVYSSFLMEVNKAILGYIENGRIFEKEEFMALVEFEIHNSL